MIIKLLRLALSAFVLLLIADSCTEQKIVSTPTGSAPSPLSNQETQGGATALVFDKSIGSPIDGATARRWMANFKDANPSVTATEHFVSASVLKKIISNSTCVGISFHYAQDVMGQLHIIPVGVASNGKMIANPGTDIGDSNVDWQTQQRWINNYKGSVRSHFFGAQSFDRVFLGLQTQIVRVTLALDDSGNPQLLLSNASDATPSEYQDRAGSCPPYCAI